MRTRYQRQMQRLMILISVLVVAGCSSQETKLLPENGPNILQIYKSHVTTSGTEPKMYRQLRNGRRDLAGYTRTASNEIDQRFPLLPNPELSLYVFPHMSKKGHPIPGYSTTFMMYQKDEYAMPGELKIK